MGKKRSEPAKQNELPAWELGAQAVSEGPLGLFARVICDKSYPIGKNDWAYVSSKGEIRLNPEIKASPKEWEYVIAHCLLHLGFGHFREQSDRLWNMACDWVIAKFLRDSHIGSPPLKYRMEFPIAVKNEEQVYQLLLDRPELAAKVDFSTTDGKPDMIWDGKPEIDYTFQLAESLQLSIREAIQDAKYDNEPSRAKRRFRSSYELAREWFVSSYPLLGAVAASFRIVDDKEVVLRMNLSVAAVNPVLQEIYINPRARLSMENWRFVLAHEFLHAALRHDLRCEDRNPVLWNIACDYVINGWLVEMKVGAMPDGILYDPEFKGLSAESLYDLLFTDLRRWIGMDGEKSGDILYGEADSKHWSAEELDRFYRSAMQQGLEYHQSNNRGYLLAALIEEIHAMSRPPIRWDVELAKWFDEYFTCSEKHRTYARMSRRQSSTPDIPRPAWRMDDDPAAQQLFGVLLDTSGSMDRHLLAAALGSIASYSAARDVNHIRLVFCDAAAYDQGVIHPDDLAETVQVRGRGGTVLQPGIDLLDRDPKFPKDAPLLIITDGQCDRLNLRGRNHAYLIPYGNRLPFPLKGPVFRLK